MTRHINLMHPDMLPGYGPVQAPWFIAAVLVSLLLSLAYGGYQWTVSQSLATAGNDWQRQVQTSQQQLDNFRADQPVVASEADLLETNQQLTRQLNNRQASLAGLNRQLGEAGQGFYQPLQGLVDYDLEGLWLDRIDMIDSSRHLGLAGFARQPGLVPRYLAQLEGSVFSGLSIQNLRIEQTDSSPVLWRFSFSDAIAQQQQEER